MMKASLILIVVVAALALEDVSATVNVVSLSTTDVSVVETSGAVTVEVVRAGSTEPCYVTFRTVKGTALPSRDYITVTGRVEFADGQALGELVIPLIPDTVPEPALSFFVVLQDFSNCVAGLVMTGAVAILDAQTVATLSEDFESGLPLGWCITTNAGTNCSWRFDNPGERPNSTGGKGMMAIADSDYAGSHAMDSELRMSPFTVASTALTYLVFKTHYVNCTYEVADVDVSVSGGGGPWVNVWRKDSADYGGPATELINLMPVARGETNVIVRFHYYNADYDWYWEVDDVAILVETDSNTNGLPDWWERTYFSIITNVPPRGDSDGDGACDEDEFIAGTSPVDAGSCFRTTGIIRSNLLTRLSFGAQLSHYYDVQSSTNIVSPIWSNRISRILGMGGRTNISLGAPGPAGFYRLNVGRW